MITPNPTHELSLEQLIAALNKKLFAECARVQLAMPPMSRALVAMLATEVRSLKSKGNLGCSRCTLQIDVLEKRATDVLHEVVSLRNSLQPVNRLPPEVLASCATFVSDTDPRPILPLTHVCRYWRRSITSNPKIWASIATGWRWLTTLCLERAGAVPLDVDITVSDIRSDEDFLEPLLPQTSRIGSLRLAGYSTIETVAGDLPGFFHSSMQNLTSLELQQTTESAELFPLNGTPIPPIFQNVARLESLRLTRTPLYPTLLSITSLRELKLLGYTSLFRFGTFLGLLKSNPGLECVALDIQFFPDSVKATSAGKVHLPRIRFLSITCSKPIDPKGLLSSISLPRGVHLEVVSTQADQSIKLGSFLPSPPTALLELLAPITTIKTRLIPQELHIFGNGSVFTFRSPKFLFDIHTELELFPGAAVRELYTSVGPRTYTVNGLSGPLRLLPALETLAFSNTAFPLGLLSALTEKPVLCPALKTLAFFDCRIDSSVMNKLGEAITERRNSMAARLYRVVIVNSTGTPPDLASIRELRKSVPCVEARVDDKLPDLS